LKVRKQIFGLACSWPVVLPTGVNPVESFLVGDCVFGAYWGAFDHGFTASGGALTYGNEDAQT
jgi:hypothetical protein